MGVGLAIWIFGLSTAVAQDSFGPWSRSMALGGEPKYAAGFKHFDYVSGQPQLGGELRLAAMGGFDKTQSLYAEGPVRQGAHGARL